MTSKQIQKYSKYSVPQLLKIATKHFNSFIRERDKNLGCISCGAQVQQAGHYIAGNHAIHKFNPDNVSGQCIRCNMYLHGNLINYRINLVKKIGKDKVELLEGTAKNFYKQDRFTLIEIILRYK